jgi:hypothetical protein
LGWCGWGGGGRLGAELAASFRGVPAALPLIQLVYASRPFGFDAAMLNGILSDARRLNPANDVTGALICRADLYLQLLEGPKDAVEATFARIAKDDRHVDVQRLVSRTIDQRLFPDWAMRDDPARSWMWTQKEVDSGALDRATEAEVVAVFERLAAEPA